MIRAVSRPKFLTYALVASAFAFLPFVGNNREPFGLALLFACVLADLSPLLCGGAFLLSQLVSGKFYFSFLLLSLGQTAIIYVTALFKNRLTEGKMQLVLFIAQILALSLFVGFAPFRVYSLPVQANFLTGAYVQKTAIAALVFLLSASFSVAAKALVHKFLRCRLKTDELIFISLLFVTVGVGICRFLGFNAYTGIAFFILFIYAYATKDATVLLCAFVLSLPPTLLFHPSVSRFFLYGIALLLFVKYGRLAETCALLTVYFLFGFFDGLYFFKTRALVSALLSALIPCLLFLLTPSKLLRKLEYETLFYREKHLSRIAINRNRAAIGEQLFEISAVFREIQTTFLKLSEARGEDGAKEYVRNFVIDRVCKKCAKFESCKKAGLSSLLDKMIDVGCMKGKTNLMDIPTALAGICVNQTALLAAVNKQLADFRKYMLEAENAVAGRQLLANQAQGISEILKNVALDQSEPLRLFQDKERALSVALLKVGIVCSEVLIYGDEKDFTVSLLTFGKASVKKLARVTSELFQKEMIISKRLALSKDKYCCILKRKPCFDAAFGVASVIKQGETASGDTHSVIKIDERRFMVALSDGMGSGEYARRISESTVSLLESFYRAKMPSELILSTINKLLSFNSEESFACVDIAVIDLDSGETDVVKIGSPFGFILSDSSMKILESASLPLGILEALHPQSNSYLLKENDVLLFLSDGVTDAFGSSADLYEALKTIPSSNPQELANALLDKALKNQGNVAKDDMTVLAVRLFKSAA